MQDKGHGRKMYSHKSIHSNETARRPKGRQIYLTPTSFLPNYTSIISEQDLATLRGSPIVPSSSNHRRAEESLTSRDPFTFHILPPLLCHSNCLMVSRAGHLRWLKTLLPYCFNLSSILQSSTQRQKVLQLDK